MSSGQDFQLKAMAQTVNFLQEHKLLAYADLEEKQKCRHF